MAKEMGVISVRAKKESKENNVGTNREVVLSVDLTEENREEFIQKHQIPRKILFYNFEKPPTIAITTLGDMVVFFFQVPEKEDNLGYGLKTAGIVMTSEIIFIMTNTENPFLREIANRIGFGDGLSEVISEIIDGYLDEIRLHEKQITEITLGTRKIPTDDNLRAAFSISQNMVYLSSGLDSIGMVLEDGTQQGIFLYDLDYYKAKNKLKYTEKELNRYMSVLAQAIDLIEGLINNRLNVIMKFLTVITIAVNVPMIIAGFWGMNVVLPFATLPWAFGLLVAASIGLTAMTMIALWRN